MKINISIKENSIQKTYQCMSTLQGDDENKEFPLFTIGKDSYIIDSSIELNGDQALVCNIHIGKYTSIARDTRFLIDQNHDYRRVSQGRISGLPYNRPELIRRKGHLAVMNDCWIGEGATILSGVTIGNGAVVAAKTVVTKDVPSFAIVAGNPAQVIGYRFLPEQIKALNEIRWWNWDEERVVESAKDLYGDIDNFINKYLEQAKYERISTKQQYSNQYIQKIGNGKRFLYIPDFEQDYPTYPNVIGSFAKLFDDTKDELMLFVKKDELIEEKINVLNLLFEKYQQSNCLINLVEGIDDGIGMLSQSDYYITNRSINNILMMDMADYYGVKILSGVDIPVFSEHEMKQHFVRVQR